MSNEKLKSMADFEWAGVARYIVYISSMAGLKEINSNHVNSLPLARLGPDKLLKSKRRVLALLEGNKSGIERFAALHKEELDVNEMAVIRSLYVQYRRDIETVRCHIEVTEGFVVQIELDILQANVGDDDDLF